MHRLHLLNLLRLVLFATITGMVGAPSCPAAAAEPVALVSCGSVLQGLVNLNTATVAQLQLLPGVGPATAAKIVAYRERRPFRSILHLMRVRGIGRTRFEAMRPYLSVEGATTLRAASG